MQGAAVEALRALYLWSGRHYRREVLRRQLWRIGPQAAEAQGHRALSCGAVASVRHGRKSHAWLGGREQPRSDFSTPRVPRAARRKNSPQTGYWDSALSVV